MAKRHKLQLTDEQTQTLRQLRDTAEQAYLRERAGALLKIAAGMSPHKVAQSGLLKQRKPDTVYAWLRAYRQQGVQGLRHKPGKVENPLSPRYPKKTQRKKSNTSWEGIRQVSPHTRRVGRCAPSAHQWPGSEKSPYQRCIRRCGDSVSAINEVEPICVAPMLNILRNSPLFNKL